MPPVMGAAAFIMAELTGITYVKIMIGASISAVLYFFSLYILVHYRALKYSHQLNKCTKEEKPNWKNILSKSYLFSPILVIFALLILGYTPLLAGFSAIVVTVLIGFVAKDINLRDFF
ncbi:hypothetical protein ES708_14367 [subsurface metagenome]